MTEPSQPAALEALMALLQQENLIWRRSGPDRYSTRTGSAEFTLTRDPAGERIAVSAVCGGRADTREFPNGSAAGTLWEQARRETVRRASVQQSLVFALGGSTYGLDPERKEAMPALVIALTNATREERVSWRAADRSGGETHICQFSGATAELACPGDSGARFTIRVTGGGFIGELPSGEPAPAREFDFLYELKKAIIRAMEEPIEPEEAPEPNTQPGPEVWADALEELRQDP